MDFLNNIFGKSSTNKNEPPRRIRISLENLNQWTKFENLFNEGKVKFDSKGRLRYLHGAPVGNLILTKINKDGTPVYKESAEDWFDPDSLIAKKFVWS